MDRMQAVRKCGVGSSEFGEETGSNTKPLALSGLGFLALGRNVPCKARPVGWELRSELIAWNSDLQLFYLLTEGVPIDP